MDKPTAANDAPSKLFALVAALCGLPLFAVGIALGHPDKGITANMSLFILIIVGRAYWKHRASSWFWGAFVLATLLHIALVSLVHFAKLGRPAIVIFAPLGIFDLFAMVAMFSFIKNLAEAAGNGGDDPAKA